MSQDITTEVFMPKQLKLFMPKQLKVFTTNTEILTLVRA